MSPESQDSGALVHATVQEDIERVLMVFALLPVRVLFAGELNEFAEIATLPDALLVLLLCFVGRALVVWVIFEEFLEQGERTKEEGREKW